jgi:hypothetical protein
MKQSRNLLMQMVISAALAAGAWMATAQPGHAASSQEELGSLDLSKLSPPTGEAKTLNVEGALLAYDAVDRIATVVADAVVRHLSSTSVPLETASIAVIGPSDLNALQQLGPFKAAATTLAQAMAGLRVPELAADQPQCRELATLGGGLPPLDGIQMALEFAQLFKVDRKFEGASVAVDEFALASTVLRKLRSRNVKHMFYSPADPGDALNPGAFANSEVLKLLALLREGMRQVDAQTAEIAQRRDRMAAREADKAKLAPACGAAFTNARRFYAAQEAHAKVLRDGAEKLIVSVTTADATTGATVLQSLVRAESLQRKMQGARILQLKPVVGGGTTYTRTNLFFTRIGVGGGAVVSYMLVGGKNGELELSDTVSEYGGFVDPRNLGSFLATRRAEAASGRTAP